jgi:threonine aldolase
MVARLAEDHANARRLAEGLASSSTFQTRPDLVRTNIVYIDIKAEPLTAASVAERLRAQGVLILPTGKHQLRAVTNYHVTTEDIHLALAALQNLEEAKRP